MSSKTKKHGRSVIALILTFVMIFSLLTTAFAGQEDSYHDPAEHWQSALNRTNELDANATTTHETFTCKVCRQGTSFLVFRTPEYSRDGQTAMTRNVKYSDGTLLDGVGTGAILDGTPGLDAYYTGYHWTKSICETCGTINSNMDVTSYAYAKNLYWLYDCATEFRKALEETVTYECADSTYHTKTVENGSYCVFCYGTYYDVETTLERHALERTIVPQLAHQRFVVRDVCTLCDYESVHYVLAKSVVADYYGVVDGKAHTLSVTDLSESGVSTQIRYGNSADTCTLISAPNYTEAGQYTVYYEIVYTYDNTEMVENGVAYVWLRGEAAADDEPSSCDCGCGDPDCGCTDNACGGECCTSSDCGEDHNYIFLDSTDPTCFTLGYDRYLCTACGKIEKRDYVNALEHVWQSILVREATCEINGKLLNICANCGQVEVTETEKGEHKYFTYSEEATCTSPGYQVKECSACGERHITDVTSALPHDYEASTVAPTCDTGGQTCYHCADCGSSYAANYSDPLGHDWDIGTVIARASCTGEGVTEYRCDRCDASRLETIPAIGHTVGEDADCTTPQTCTTCNAVIEAAMQHDFQGVVTDATCTTMGYTTYICANCDVCYKSDYTDPLGHDYVPSVTEATCLEGGFTTYTCSRCEDSYVAEQVDPLGHTWDEGTVISEASCTGEGVTEYRCVTCNESRLETIPATGHTPGDAATCTDPQTCTDCGAVIENALKHDFQAVVTEATCSAMGYTTYTCGNCQFSYKSDYTDPLGHDHVPVVTEPTCLEGGYTTYTCSRCEDSYISDRTEALGHEWDQGRRVTDSTCDGEGLMEYRCVRCDYHRLEALSADGHTPGDAATCTMPQLCTVCGAVLENALGHNYESEVTAPTCTEMGYTTYTCDGCGDSYKGDYTDAVGHEESDWIIDKEPTIYSEGSKHKECLNCGEVLASEIIEKIYMTATTDTHGEAVVGGYLVIVTDTDTGYPIANAAVELTIDNSLSIRLPDNRLLDYGNQTTVTVLMQKDKSAVWGMGIAVTDKNGNYSADTTDIFGRVTVPEASGKTNDEGKVTVGSEDADGNFFTLTVKVEDYETGRPIEGSKVSIGKTGNITVVLPDGVDMDENNRITVTVTDNEQIPQSGMTIIVKSDLGRKETGLTDENGKLTVPAIADIEEHTAYIYGYPDGTFGPERSMTRSEAVAIFARLLADKMGVRLTPVAVTKFDDIPANAWYSGYVDYLVEFGIVSGRAENVFAPNEPITRAEFTVMAVRFFDVYGDGDAVLMEQYTEFTDIAPGYWAAEYIRDAALYGWVRGYGDETFRPTASITRAEVVTLMGRLLGREADKEYIDSNLRWLNTFSDMTVNHWAYYAVMEAANSHIADMSSVENWSE